MRDRLGLFFGTVAGLLVFVVLGLGWHTVANGYLPSRS
jgi:hypothetical protein